MRLLNSVCKVIADAYPDVPIHIKQVPQDFERPCFYVHLVTHSKSIKSYNTAQFNPDFQIIYFGERDEANQVLAEPLYEAQDKLDELFLLRLAVPVILKEGEKRKRYAKIQSYNSQLRESEGALYCDLVLDFTDEVPHDNNYDLIESVDLKVITEN